MERDMSMRCAGQPWGGASVHRPSACEALAGKALAGVVAAASVVAAKGPRGCGAGLWRRAREAGLWAEGRPGGAAWRRASRPVGGAFARAIQRRASAPYP